VSADLRLAEPRRVTLPSIVKAKQKPLVTREAAAPLDAQCRVLTLNDPPVREPGVKVEGIAALLDALAGQRVFETAGA
jgi:electron transfer flavoprotein beta subunit